MNIPLAYVDVDFTKYKIQKIVDTKFSSNKKSILIPEQLFDTKDFKVFNNFEEEINTQNLFIFNNGKYKYSPANMVKFEPKKFLWKATVKKNLDYSISNTYDLNIGCKYSEELNQAITTTFMNPGSRNDLLVYSNVKINSNNTAYDTFTNVNEDKADIMFIKTHNCKHVDIENTKEIDMTGLLDLHTNLWLGCEDAVALKEDYKMLSASTVKTFKIANPIVSNNATISTSHYFDLTTITPPSGVSIHNIFTTTLVPALILEYDNKGFVIITSYEVLDNPLSYESYMYELMMYVYLNTYLSTDYINEWITYNIPSYEIVNNTYSTKNSFTSKSNINSLLNLKGNCTLTSLNIIDDVENSSNRILDTGYDLENTTGAIKCVGTSDGKPIFVVDGNLDGYTEPTKETGWSSIYNSGYVYYLNTLHYLLETDLTNKISLLEQDNNLIIKIYNFKSSTYNINKKSDTTIQIPFIKTNEDRIERIKEAEYTIYMLKDQIGFCYKEDYVNEDLKYKLFDIIVSQTEEAVNIYDMRQLGGGLSEDEDDNFELMDIGHINGRPYRIGGALVITMPTKYKPYEDYIQRAIDKFKVAEDYIAIVFKDEEEEK